jgi:hypothetical protein
MTSLGPSAQATEPGETFNGGLLSEKLGCWDRGNLYTETFQCVKLATGQSGAGSPILSARRPRECRTGGPRRGSFIRRRRT